MSTKYNVQDYIGKKFGKWTILKEVQKPISKKGKLRRGTFVECECECGRKSIIQLDRIISGYTKSCVSCAASHHGYRYSRLYSVWRGMKNRCYNVNCPEYDKYGGRGIIVCDEWKNDFIAFCIWGLANGYDDNAKYGECTLDRIDVNGNDCPENCRWVNMHIQITNQRLSPVNTSGYAGVHKASGNRKKCWQAGITLNYKYKFLGRYATKKEAVEARNKYIIDNNLTEYKIQEWKDE